MKIGVVGCGALGTYYGAKLCSLGHPVHFLLRSDYFEVRSRGVSIRSVHGDFQAHPLVARDPSEIGACDLVVIGLKTTANHEFERLLTPLVRPGSLILTLHTGLVNEERLAALFGADRVLGGLCFVCLNRVAPGVVEHTAHGDVVLGEFAGRAQPRTEACAELFRAAGIRCKLTDDLAKAHWEKLLWNIPFNGLGVAGTAGYEAVIRGDLTPNAPRSPCLSTDLLIGDPRWLELVRELMAEVIAAARGNRHELSSDLIEDLIRRTQKMGSYKASTLLDFEVGRPLELESLFAEPLCRAEAAGVRMPRLAALTAVLTQLSTVPKK